MLEKELERKFVKAVKKAGGRTYKFVSPGNAGVPDRLVILPGNHIGFVELKQTGKKPTAIQNRQMDRLENLGCHVYLLDRPEEIDELINDLKCSVAHADDEAYAKEVMNP